jgi:hypothetical protein
MIVRAAIDRMSLRKKPTDSLGLAGSGGGGKGRQRRRGFIAACRIDTPHQVGPGRRAVRVGETALCGGKADRLFSCQALRLLAQMFTGGILGEIAARAVGGSRHDKSFPCAPGVRRRAGKVG